MSQTRYEIRPLRTLKPDPENARLHSKKQQGRVTGIIKQVGFINPIVVNAKGKILAGHARFAAAKSLGHTTVPVIVVNGLTAAEEQAYVLADNKIPEGATWDRPLLATQLNNLAPLLAEEGLSIDLAGFEAPELDGLAVDLLDPEQDPIDELPQLAGRPISHTADLWQLGHHRLYCGDSCQEVDVRAAMEHEFAAAIFSDPPFNVRIRTTVGRGKIDYREFAFASGEMSPSQFIAFLKKWMRLGAQFSKDGSIHYVCMDWRHLEEILAAGTDVYSELKNVVVWAKTNAGQGSFYRSQHEFIFVFKNGNASHQNNIELGRHGRNRSNVWTYAGVNTFRAGRLDELAIHPTVKPVALVADAIRDCTRRGEIILDPFMGSGTTILAAEKVGRRAYGLEIDPLYVDVAIRRWQAFTGRDAILQTTAQTFDEVATGRLKPKIPRVR